MLKFFFLLIEIFQLFFFSLKSLFKFGLLIFLKEFKQKGKIKYLIKISLISSENKRHLLDSMS